MRERAVSFHARRPELAIGHQDNTVSVYDLTTAKRVQRLTVGTAPFCLAFHPRDGRLAVGCGNGVKLFDVGTARELPALRHPSNLTVYAVAWHPDGRLLATSCLDRKIHLWDTQTATEYASPLEAPGITGNSVAFSPEGDRLASSHGGRATEVWDLASGRRVLSLPGMAWAFGANARVFGWSISGSNVRLWEMTGGRELRVFRSRKGKTPIELGHCSVDATGRILAAGVGHWLNFYDLEWGGELASVQLPRRDSARPVFFAPPRRSVSSGKTEQAGGWVTGGYGAVYWWPTRLDTARPGALKVGPPRRLAPDGSGAGYSTGTGLSPDGRLVAVPQGRTTLVLHQDRPGWQLVLGPQHDVRNAAVSPDGRWVVTCSWWCDDRSRSIRIWDAKTGRQVHEMLEGASLAAFSPDSRWLMTTSGSGSHLWEVETWREVRRWDWTYFAFSRGGLLAISAPADGIRLLETATGREVARLTGPDPGAYQPKCFSPDGTRLVAGGPAGLYVWDLRLIRRSLKEIGLDWEWPDFQPPDASGREGQPLAVEVDLGELASPDRAERARQAIARYRRLIAAKPNDAAACNNLAWMYLTAPDALRDVKAALPLAEKAVRLAPGNAIPANTLGLAYYRAGRYREAVDILRSNLARQDEWALTYVLYFLAMSYHQLGETARARDYYELAVRWQRSGSRLAPEQVEELDMFRLEASELLGVAVKSKVESAPPR
jgi:WD40 repeat protein